MQSKNASVLRSVGLRATPQRTRILGALMNAARPKCAQDLAGMLRMDQVTVYRTLEAFRAAGLARQIDLQQGRAYFEYADEDHHHHHIVCRTCGQIEDVDNCELETITERMALQSRKFRSIRSHSLEFFGDCIACAK